MSRVTIVILSREQCLNRKHKRIMAKILEAKSLRDKLQQHLDSTESELKSIAEAEVFDEVYNRDFISYRNSGSYYTKAADIDNNWSLNYHVRKSILAVGMDDPSYMNDPHEWRKITILVVVLAKLLYDRTGIKLGAE